LAFSLRGTPKEWISHKTTQLLAHKLFPTWLQLLALVGLGLIVSVLRGNHGTPDGDEPGDPFTPLNLKTMAIVATAIGLHVILLEIAGYVIAATVCFWGVAYGFGSRRILKDLCISAVFAFVVYFSFSKGLNINLPSGFFDGILSNGK